MLEVERKARLRLSLVEGLGPKRFHSILDGYGSVLGFLKERPAKEVVVLHKKTIDSWRRKCYEIDIDRFLENLRNRGIGYFVFGEKDYPKTLNEIKPPPVVIYYKGDIKNTNFERCISIVGTRANTDYGRRMASRLIEPLVNVGYCIVSGMAFGIDKIAHEQAIKFGGKTIAVLASSVDDPSPYNNVSIYRKILKNGLVISEYPPGTTPSPGMFPVRNRIIAGISLATVVIEAGERSGALITAHTAFDASRSVFAVPSDAFSPKSKGCNHLIKINRAKLVTCAEDIFEEIKYMFPKNALSQTSQLSLPDSLSALEKDIIDKLKLEPANEDKLIKLFDIPTHDLLASLSGLEIEGLIRRREDGCYMLCC